MFFNVVSHSMIRDNGFNFPDTFWEKVSPKSRVIFLNPLLRKVISEAESKNPGLYF